MNQSRPFYAVLLCAVACACGLALFDACTTVTPGIVVPKSASYSGNERNSGVITLSAAGWVVDGDFRNRYNDLIATYGPEYSLRRDAGIVLITAGAAPADERWLIDRQHFDVMLRMNVKKHSGIAPTRS